MNSDALPEEHRPIDWEEEVEKLGKKSVSIYAVQCGNSSTNFYKNLASKSDGKLIKISDMTSIVDTFMGLCYREAAEVNFQANAEQIKEQISKLPRTGSAQLIMPKEMISSGLKLDDNEILEIHNAIHQEGKYSIKVHGTEYPISRKETGCKFVQVGDLTFIEQNKKKNTKYARMALKGHSLTWIVRFGRWGLIIDNNIERR